jgi:Ca-activated chloride channel homolog
MKKITLDCPALSALIFIILVCIARPVSAQADRKLIREGNRLYHKEQFSESELSYRRALEKDESLQARFNLGNSLFKQERFDEAVRFYGELAGEVDDPVNRSKIFHNLGNSMLMSGQIEESIEAYKEALRNNPRDEETRYNLAFAQHLLDEKENQQQQDSNDRQDGEDSQEQDDQGEQQEDDQSPDQDQQESDPGSSDQEQAPRPRPDQISPEDALRMLEAAEREEQRVQEKLMEEKASEKRPPTGKNW